MLRTILLAARCESGGNSKNSSPQLLPIPDTTRIQVIEGGLLLAIEETDEEYRRLSGKRSIVHDMDSELFGMMANFNYRPDAMDFSL